MAFRVDDGNFYQKDNNSFKLNKNVMKSDDLTKIGELIGKPKNDKIKINLKPGNTMIMNIGSTKIEDIILPDSELGKKIADRQAELDARRAKGSPHIVGEKPNPYDNYEPVYEVDLDSPWNDKHIIGYRPKTEQEKQGTILY